MEEDDYDIDMEEMWFEWDSNGDNYIDHDEIIQPTKMQSDAVLILADVDNMFKEFGLDWDGDNRIGYEEFMSSDAKGVDYYIRKLRDSWPRLKRRHSQQAWLDACQQH